MLGAAGSLLLAQGASGAVTLVSDDFSDGDRTNSPAWYLVEDTTTTTLGVVDGGAGNNVMQLGLTGTGAATRAATVNFADVTLSNPGDYVRLSFSARWTGTTTVDRSFGFGFWDTLGTQVSEDGNGGTNDTDGAGYHARIDVLAHGGTSGSLYYNQPGFRIFSTNTAGTFGATSSTASRLTATSKQFEFLIERSTDGVTTDAADLTLTLIVDGVELISSALSSKPLDPATLTFGNAVIGFNSNNTTGNLLIDDVAITTNVPEPASLALLGLGGLAMVARRRRS